MWWLTIDLFASNHNHQLLVYYSRSKDPRVLAVDARSIPWSGTSAYTFPPISLIQKVSREDCTLLLIAPFWPTSFGFIPPATGGSRATSSVPSTAGSIADAGVESSIQQRRALAFDGLDAVSQCFRTVFLKSLLSWQPELEDRHHSRYILRVCDPTMTGAEGEKSLQLVHLLQS